jgi:hypothetical protein
MPRPCVTDGPLPAITDPASGTRPASTPSTMHAPARLRGWRPLCRYALPGNDDIPRATRTGRFIVGQSFALNCTRYGQRLRSDYVTCSQCPRPRRAPTMCLRSTPRRRSRRSASRSGPRTRSPHPVCRAWPGMGMGMGMACWRGEAPRGLCCWIRCPMLTLPRDCCRAPEIVGPGPCRLAPHGAHPAHPQHGCHVCHSRWIGLDWAPSRWAMSLCATTHIQVVAKHAYESARPRIHARSSHGSPAFPAKAHRTNPETKRCA